MKRSLVSTITTFSLLTAATSAFAYDEEESEEDGGEGGGNPTAPPDEDVPWLVNAMQAPSFGDDWGAGLFVRAYVGGTPASESDSFHDELKAGVKLGAFAKINGESVPLLGVALDGLTISQRGTELTRRISIWKFIVNTERATTDLAGQQQLVIEATPISQAFFDERVNLWVGPVPVTFTATAVGEVGSFVKGRVDTLGLSAETGPFARAVLDATGAIGGEWCIPYTGPCVGASAGIEVQLRLVDIQASGKVTVTSLGANTDDVRVDYFVELGAQLEMLAGYLRLFAEAYIGGLGDRWRTTLWSWEGYHDNWLLGAGAGTHCLVGDCFESGTGVQDGTDMGASPDPFKSLHTDSPDDGVQQTVGTGSGPATSVTYETAPTLVVKK